MCESIYAVRYVNKTGKDVTQKEHSVFKQTGSYKTSYVIIWAMGSDVPSCSQFLKVSHQLMNQCPQADADLSCGTIWCVQESEDRRQLFKQEVSHLV